MIQLRNLTKRFGSVLANDRLSLAIPRGQLVTLLGPSGCGKTTTLRCITGHNRPDEGQVILDGRDVTDVPTYRRNLGMVFQNFALFPHMTVRENVEFPLRVRGEPSARRRELAGAALEMVRLVGLGDRYPRQLSGGQQQRVGLARALVYRPSVLLLDEPLSNLDAKLREEMRFEIRDLQTRLGITAVYVTHDQEEALALSDQVAVLNAGRLEQMGTPSEIYDEPATPFVADFVGLSNFLEGAVAGVEPDGQVLVQVGPWALPARGGHPPAVGAAALLFIRPGDVELSPAADDGGLPATVEQFTYLGDRVDYRLRLEGGLALRAQTARRGEAFSAGSAVRAHLPPDRCRAMAPR